MLPCHVSIKHSNRLRSYVLKRSHKCFSVISVVTFPTQRDGQGLLKNKIRRDNKTETCMITVQLMIYKEETCDTNLFLKSRLTPWFDQRNTHHIPWLCNGRILATGCKNKMHIIRKTEMWLHDITRWIFRARHYNFIATKK